MIKKINPYVGVLVIWSLLAIGLLTWQGCEQESCGKDSPRPETEKTGYVYVGNRTIAKCIDYRYRGKQELECTEANGDKNVFVGPFVFRTIEE